MNWITDKQPAKTGWYLTTVNNNDLPMVMELYWDGRDWKDNRRIDVFKCYEVMGFKVNDDGIPYKTRLYPREIPEIWWTDKVIAWGIFPFPYDKEVE